jgi:predicted acetyltransferase
MSIAVLPAENRPPELAWLIQQYQAEIGQSDSLNGGRAAAQDLASALVAPAAQIFVIVADQLPVGFVILSQHSRLEAAFDGHAMLALFILPVHRRKGYGRTAAIELFERFPGTWEIATFGANIPGISFWRSVADTYTGGRYRETWLQNAQWRGSIQIFTAPGVMGDADL